MNPNLDSKILKFPKPQNIKAKSGPTKIEGNVEGADIRDSLKVSAFKVFDTLSLKEIRSLLKHVVVLEDFLFDTNNPRENVRVYDSMRKKIYYEIKAGKHSGHPGAPLDMRALMLVELKSVVGGMINALPAERLKWVWENQKEFLDVISGTKKPVMDTASHADVAPEKSETISEVTDFESEEKLFHSLSAVAMESMPKVSSPDPLQYLEDIKEEYFKNGLNVEVVFYPEHKDYVIVSAATQGKEVGIVVPRPGTKLDMTMAFDLFKTDKKETVLSPDTIASFPQVENRLINHNSDDKAWVVSEYGSLK